MLPSPAARPLAGWLLPAWLGGAVALLLLMGSFTWNSPAQPRQAAAAQAQFARDAAALHQQARQLAATLRLLGAGQASLAQARQALQATKLAYKRTEYLTEYLDPELARQLNGPPLPRVVVNEADYLALRQKEPQHTTLLPEGLQVLEEQLFGDETPDLPETQRLAGKLAEDFTRFATRVQHQPLSEAQVLAALREEILRVMTQGITGFDAPAAGDGLLAAAAALDPLPPLLENGPDPAAARLAAGHLRAAANYLREHADFDAFDRVHFLREVAGPAYAAVVAATALPAAEALSQPVSWQATSLFAVDFLQPAYFAKQDRQASTGPAQIALGQLLFFDPVLSGDNQRACASCHHPAQAFTDGAARSLAFGGGPATLRRNAPTLLNAAFSAAYFWDGRAGFLEDQIPEVVSRPDELHTSYAALLGKLGQSRAYRQRFRAAFPAEGAAALSASTVNRALAAYLRSLVALNSPFDRYMRRETAVLDASVRRGANLFMGKAACATCHFAPIFNGTVPPRFLETETEVIGVPAGPNLAHAAPDADAGRGEVVPAAVLQGAFKTPTVRNLARTAPYMHNGVFQTLPEVVEFYNRGGGAGLGLALPHQTLPFDHLSLTEQEKADVVAFLESLSDSTTRYAAPARLPPFPAATGWNTRPVGGRY